MTTYEEPQTAASLLKQHTAFNHQELEAVVAPQLEGLHSLEDYQAFLKKFYGYIKPVEDRIAQYITDTQMPDIAQRRNATRILADLTFSNSHKPVPELATDLPHLSNTAQAFGALYVLEGSTLGGRGITSMLLKNKALNVQPEQIQYFNGYGENTGPMWLAFLKTVNNHAANTVATTQMVEAANDTFAFFKKWLQK